MAESSENQDKVQPSCFWWHWEQLKPILGSWGDVSMARICVALLLGAVRKLEVNDFSDFVDGWGRARFQKLQDKEGIQVLECIPGMHYLFFVSAFGDIPKNI